MVKKSVTKKEKEKTTDSKLRIGSLVCVRTHNSFADNWTNITTTAIPYITTPNINPWVTTPYVSPYTGGGTITTPTVYPNYPTVVSNEPEWIIRDDINSYNPHSTEYTDIIEKTDFSKEEMDGLRKLYDGYLNKSSGQGGNTSGNTLGMTIWHGPPGGLSNPKWKIANNNTSTIKVNGPTTTISAGTSTVTVNMPTKFEFDFHAKGYRKIEDFFLSTPTNVKQEEVFTEEEIEAFNKEGNVFLQWGKPFKGIVVDVFSPELKTENGEEVLLGVNKFPKMYKVLIGEKDCLWFTESDVYAMTNKE